MTINAANWVGEYTVTTGTGPIALAGAVRGFARFNVMGDGQVYYVIQDGLVKETGLGTLTGDTLERTTIHATIDANGVYSQTPVPIDLSGNAQVYGIVNAEFMKTLYDSSQTVFNAVTEVTDAAAAAEAAKVAAESAAQDAETSANNAANSAASAASSEQVTIDNAADVTVMTEQVNQALQVVLSAAGAVAGAAGYPWYYTAQADGETTIQLPSTMDVSAVNEIYIEGMHQDVNKHFKFDPETKLISDLVQPLNNGTEVTVIVIGTPQDTGNPFQELLASEAGASQIGKIGGGTVQDFISKVEKEYQMISVWDYMTPAEIAAANNPNGNTDHSAAFAAAFAAGVALGIRTIFVPPVAGRYIVGDVVIPARTKLQGVVSYKVYDVANDASFNNCGSVIRKKSGSNTQFQWSSGCGADSILFDGVDRTASAIFSSTGGKISVGFVNCGFYRWARVGNDNGKYIGCSFRSCSFNQNSIGLYNTIDGNHMSCVFNANKINGVRLETGADSNSFTGCRNEWNGGDNWNLYGCTSISIIGEICDRADGYGFRISGSSVYISGVAIRRNGRSATGQARSHMYIEASDVKIDGIVTSTGADDSGGSVTTPSPDYVINWGGATGSGSFDAVNSNLKGFLVSLYANSPRAAERRITNCRGAENDVNAGVSKQSNGHYYYAVKADTKAIGTTPVTLDLECVKLDTFSNDIQKVQITWRNTAGGSNGAECLILRYREGGNAGVNILNIACKNGVIGELDVNDPATPANQLYTISMSANTDGSIVTVSMKAKSTNAANFYVRAYLKS